MKEVYLLLSEKYALRALFIKAKQSKMLCESAVTQSKKICHLSTNLSTVKQVLSG